MSKHKDIFLFIVLFLFIFSTGKGQTGINSMKDTSAFIKGLQLFSKSTSSIESDFVQEKKLKMLNDKVISKGHLLFKKENKLRWEYTEPYSYIIVLNNGKVMMSDEGKISTYDANSNKLFLELNDILITCINGNIFQNKKFTFRFMENEKSNIVELTPISSAMKNFLNSITLYLDRNDFTVSRVEMAESSQNNTLIVFKNKKLNVEIPENLFVLH